MKPKFVLPAVLGGLAVYLLRFYTTPLPSLAEASGTAWYRFDVLALLWHPEVLRGAWFGEPVEFAVADRLPVIALAAAIWLWAGLVGWLLLALGGAERGWSRCERFVLAMALGLNAVSTYVLLVGLLGALNRLWVFILPGTATLAAAAWLGWRRRNSISRPSSPACDPRVSISPSPSLLSHRWLGLAAPFLAVILLGGMLPPIEFDVREYHLQVPKEFFAQGRIGFLPHNAYGNMAMGSEMFSLLGMVIAGDWWLGALAGKTVIAAFAPLTAVALYAAGRRLFSPTAGIVAAVLYSSTTWIVQVSNYGMVEGPLGFYLLLTVYMVARQAFPPDPRLRPSGRRTTAAEATDDVRPESLMYLAGYFAGAAAAAKYSAVLFVVLPVTLWMAFTRLRADSRSAWRPLAAFALAAVLGGGLWFGKNWVLTGNPTYPLLYRVFGGQTWTAEKNALWNQVHQPHDFSLAALAGDVGRVLMSSEWHHPLLVPLVVLALLPISPGTAQPGVRRRLLIGLTGYAGLVIAAWWLFALRHDRHWLAVLPVLALVAGAGACWSGERVWRGALMGLLLLTAVPNFLSAAGIPLAGGYNRYFVSLAGLRTAPERLDPWHRYFNTHVPEGRVLLVGEACVFDLEVPILYNTWIDDSWFQRIVQGHTSAEVHDQLHAAGISHVYVHWGEIARYRATHYGRWDFFQPEVFDQLVADGVLQPLPALPGHPGRGYWVRPSNREAHAGN